MAERVEAVFVNAGSYVMRPKSSSSTFIWRKSIARAGPSVMSISYVLPVRLSVTDSVSLAVATPPALPSLPWVSSLMHLSLRSGHGPPAGQRLRAKGGRADRARTRVGARTRRARRAGSRGLTAAGRMAGRRAWRPAGHESADRRRGARGAVGGRAHRAAPASGLRGGDAGTPGAGVRAGRARRRPVRGRPRAARPAARGRRSLRRRCRRLSPGWRAWLARAV